MCLHFVTDTHEILKPDVPTTHVSDTPEVNIGWLADRLADWLDGWMADWLVDWVVVACLLGLASCICQKTTSWPLIATEILIRKLLFSPSAGQLKPSEQINVEIKANLNLLFSHGPAKYMQTEDNYRFKLLHTVSN